MKNPIDCETANERLSEFLDAEVPEEILEAIREHLKLCPDCKVRFDKAQRTITLYQVTAGGKEMPVFATVKLTEAMQRAYAKQG